MRLVPPLLKGLLLALAVIALNFMIPRLMPGDPLDAITAAEAESGISPLSSSARQSVRAYYGLDLPIAEQFSRYLSGLTRADLGFSIGKQAPVTGLILERLPWTVGVIGTALVAAGLCGVAVGVVAAWRGGKVGGIANGLAGVLEATPEFLIGIVLIVVFAVTLRWLPLSGGRSAFSDAGPLLAGLDIARHLALPTLTLFIGSVGAFFLLSRGVSREVVRLPFVTAAVARGLSSRAVLIRHVLPNVLPPIGTLSGLRLAQVVGGAILIERLFAIPGVGLLASEAIGQRDYPVLQACFLLSGLTMVFLLTTLDLWSVLQARRYGGQ